MRSFWYRSKRQSTTKARRAPRSRGINGKDTKEKRKLKSTHRPISCAIVLREDDTFPVADSCCGISFVAATSSRISSS